MTLSVQRYASQRSWERSRLIGNAPVAFFLSAFQFGIALYPDTHVEEQIAAQFDIDLKERSRLIGNTAQSDVDLEERSRPIGNAPVYSAVYAAVACVEP